MNVGAGGSRQTTGNCRGDPGKRERWLGLGGSMDM